VAMLAATRKIGQAALERYALQVLAHQLREADERYRRQAISTSELLSTINYVATFLTDLSSDDAYTRRVTAKILTHRN
jgi:hypothetical protein